MIRPLIFAHVLYASQLAIDITFCGASKCGCSCSAVCVLLTLTVPSMRETIQLFGSFSAFRFSMLFLFGQGM